MPKDEDDSDQDDEDDDEERGMQGCDDVEATVKRRRRDGSGNEGSRVDDVLPLADGCLASGERVPPIALALGPRYRAGCWLVERERDADPMDRGEVDSIAICWHSGGTHWCCVGTCSGVASGPMKSTTEELTTTVRLASVHSFS